MFQWQSGVFFQTFLITACCILTGIDTADSKYRYTMTNIRLTQVQEVVVGELFGTNLYCENLPVLLGIRDTMCLTLKSSLLYLGYMPNYMAIIRSCTLYCSV